MPDPTAAQYCRFADSRLAEAKDKLQSVVALGYNDNIVEAAKIASLVWDAAIDILSALALQDGLEVTGVSSDMRQYARHNLPERLFRNWHHLARLHNFPHKPNLPENEFLAELYYAGNMLASFNGHLPQSMQLSTDRFAWLTASGNQPNT